MTYFDNKKSLVLGGTSGIGLAIARALVDHGSEVIVGSRRGQCEGLPAEKIDVLDREALKRLFAKQGPFDFLINAATGGERAVGPFMEMDLDGFQQSFAKLWGYVNAVRLGVPHVVERGAIVLISGSPARRCRPGMSAISTVGNAVEGFVRAVAPEIAPKRINAVSPGLIDTPMFPAQGAHRERFFKEATHGNLIPRAGTPDEVASAVLFLLENQFVTGTTVDVDGGAILAP